MEGSRKTGGGTQKQKEADFKEEGNQGNEIKYIKGN